MAVLQCAINALRDKKRGFDYNFHNRVEQGGGVYAFWLNTAACLYVGESNAISRRMYQHRMREHNPDLERYFAAFSRRIEVSYYIVQEQSDRVRRQLENELIKALRPITNKTAIGR